MILSVAIQVRYRAVSRSCLDPQIGGERQGILLSHETISVISNGAQEH